MIKKMLFLFMLSGLSQILASDSDYCDNDYIQAILTQKSQPLDVILKNSANKPETTVEAGCLVLFSELMQEQKEDKAFNREQELQAVRKKLGFDKK